MPNREFDEESESMQLEERNQVQPPQFMRQPKLELDWWKIILLIVFIVGNSVREEMTNVSQQTQINQLQKDRDYFMRADRADDQRKADREMMILKINDVVSRLDRVERKIDMGNSFK